MTDAKAVERSRRPDVLTLALVCALAAAGALLVRVCPDRPVLTTHTALTYPALLLGVGVALLLAELGQGLVEFRRQAYSFCLTGAALVVGVLHLDPAHLVLVRVVTALVAFAIQRTPATKTAYNAATYLLDAAALAWLVHTLIGPGSAVDLHAGLVVTGALAGVDLVMSALVLVVICLHGGRVSARGVLDIFVPAEVVAVLNAVLGVTCALLLQHGSLGVTLLGALAAATGLAYHGYLRLRRRHQSLELIQGFIEDAQREAPPDELVTTLLRRLQEAMRAARVDLVVEDGDGGCQRFTHALDGVPDTTGAAVEDLPNRPAAVSTRTAVDADRRLLDAYGANEILVVPVPRRQGRASLLAVDRLGDLPRFTATDLTLFHALGGHLGVALQNVELVDTLRHEASHDALTGLANRASLLRRLEAALRRGPARRPAVLLLDLNRFKEVNDTLGHHVGDQLLQVVSQRLQNAVRAGSIVARLGGDEFVVLVPEVESIEPELVRLAARIGDALRSPVDLPAATLSTEASIGIAWADAQDTAADVLRHADTAMYAAKSGGERMVVYTPELDAGRAERLSLLADLHLALERGELVLHYQPKLYVEQNQVLGVESLVRWEHPRLGHLSPGVFMPIAESTGLIELVTGHVLDLALAQARRWMEAGTPITVAVNVSARNLLNPNLPDLVASALERAQVPPDLLVLEITESSVMGDPSRTMPILERLAATGLTLSLDDFGTGYSSLSYLQRLPVREVKIDRSFVIGMFDAANSATSRVLVESIIGLGAKLGLRVVAEGVEDEETLNLLRDLGCDVVQGYLVGRPASAQDLRLQPPRVAATPRLPAPRGSKTAPAR